MIVLHVFRDSEREAGGWVGQTWQFQCDVIIEQHVKLNRSGIEYTFFIRNQFVSSLVLDGLKFRKLLEPLRKI